MVFQRRPKKDDREFHLGNENIDIEQNYTYSGSSTGNVTISLDQSGEKAFHALFSLRQHKDFSSLKPSLPANFLTL